MWPTGCVNIVVVAPTVESNTLDPDPCVNCGADAPQRYCPDCGQATRSPRAPLRELTGELFSSVFSLDSRAFKSLPTLLFRPGRLTRDFLLGHRASQVPPLRMYLLVSLVFFLFFQHPAPDVNEKTAVWVDDVQVSGPTSGKAGSRIELLRFKGSWARKFIRPLFATQVDKLIQMDPQVLVNSVFAAVERAIPAGLFLFLPLLAGVMKILFWRRRGLYFDHLIFALHFQTFFFLALTTAYLFRLTPYFTHVIVAALVLTPFYLGLALRTMWEEKWYWILVKTTVLFFAYIYLGAMVYVSVMVYTVAML